MRRAHFPIFVGALALTFFAMPAEATKVRVIKLGNQGRAIVDFESNPALKDGARIVLQAPDEDLDGFQEEVRVTLVKIKARKAIVKFPAQRSLRVGEVFDWEAPGLPRSRRSAHAERANDAGEEESVPTPIPIKFGGLLGGAYERDLGGLEAGDSDYGSTWTWKNYQLGALARYEMPNPQFGFQAAVIFAKRSYAYSLATSSLTSKILYDTYNAELPLEAYYKIILGPRLALTPGAGLNLRYGYGKVKVSTTNETASSTTGTATQIDSKAYEDVGLSRLAYEVILRTGIDYAIKSSTLFCDFKIHYGLNDRSTVSGEKTKKAMSFNFTTGILF